MQFLEKEISQLMRTIWEDFLELDISPNPDGPPASGEGLGLTSCLHITGAWEGIVALRCSNALSRKIAGTMFGIEPNEATEEQIVDAVGELTNMTGGNLKALMKPPCRISLPIITMHSGGPIQVPGGKLLSEVAFIAAGENFVVSVLEGAAIPAEG